VTAGGPQPLPPAALPKQPTPPNGAASNPAPVTPPPKGAALPPAPPPAPPQKQASLTSVPPPAPPPTVRPACEKKPVPYVPDQNDSATISETSIGGSACHHNYTQSGSLRLTGSSIVAQPSHGKLVQTGRLDFDYQPAPGYKGSDRYVIKVCGTSDHRSGCSTLTYPVTVQ
jgi:hypothetical protein